MKRALILAAVLLAPALLHAQHSHAQADAAKATPAAGAMSQAEVRKVDKSAGKLTLKHGPIANLDMPPMTMVFRVKDPAMLDKVKAGDSVSFKAEKIEGNYTVTEIQPAK